MKITAVEPFHISVPYDFGNTAENAAAAQWAKMETLFVKVTTDDGVIGWGEGFGLAACGITKVAVEKAIAPLAVGRDPTDIAALKPTSPTGSAIARATGRSASRCRRSTSRCGTSPASARESRSIACSAAPRPSQRMPAYASLLRYGNADVVRKNSATAVARGYRDVKLHEIGVAEIAAAREAIGPDIVAHGRRQLRLDRAAGDRDREQTEALPSQMAGRAAVAAGGLCRHGAVEDGKRHGDRRRRERRNARRHRAAHRHRGRRLHPAQHHQDRRR